MERFRKSDGFGTYYIAAQPNHDYEAKNGRKQPPGLEQLNGNSVKPKGDYTLDEKGWLIVNGKPLRPTRFARR